MFTGLIEACGKVRQREETGDGACRLRVELPEAFEEVAVGDSVAINGCCLTAVETGEALAFDLLAETRRRTNLGELEPGAGINLERSLRADARLGGHFVAGHVDEKGEVLEARYEGADLYLRVGVGEANRRYLIEKGSIAVDGVSLTVAEVQADGFAVWLIPHTVAMTNLGERQPGDRVNLEFDLLGKYVERLLVAGTKSPYVR